MGTESQGELQNAYEGNVCPKCRETGYFGRVGLFELMTIDDDIRRLVQAQAIAAEIRAVALRRGLQLLRRNGIEKINTGVTMLEEVLRVSQVPG